MFTGVKDVVDTETGQPVTPAEIMTAYKENEHLIQLFSDIETGLVTPTLADYHAMPDVIKQAWRLYLTAITEHKKHGN